MIFMDDMLIIYHQTHRPEALELKNKLREAYELKELGEISKFIGIRIIRDRPNRKL
jgi:predicted AAA+ superfamily ATPase